MSNNQLLKAILGQQSLDENSAEYKSMIKQGEEIQTLLSASFQDDEPVIQFAGSQAKGTMVKSKYDLDITCYFTSGSNTAGNSLKELFEAVKEALSGEYLTEVKNSAIKIYSQNEDGYLHVDVVPGRFVDGKEGDVFLHVEKWDEHRLKTNLQTHISHVRNSGFLEEIKLMKIWNTRNGGPFKTFILELLTIKVLQDNNRKGMALDENIEFLFSELSEKIDTIAVEDPANPAGNDLSLHFDSTMRLNAKMRLEETARLLETHDWEGIFVPLEKASHASIKTQAVNSQMNPHYYGK